jgi:cytochrome oxidase assembly protein ShyY1
VYDASAQALVRNWSVDGQNGFAVLTPLRTDRAVLLLARGFLPQPGSGGVPSVPAPPSGTVTVEARVQPPESRHDQAALLGGRQVESINPGDQARRLGTRVYDGYAQLDPHQPGTAGLTALPGPDLSNPAGGALEPQHFAYVIQWYLFAALALAAPFAMARAELKQRRARGPDAEDEFADAAPAPEPAPVQPALSEEERRAAKLADRYGHAR